MFSSSFFLVWATKFPRNGEASRIRPPYICLWQSSLCMLATKSCWKLAYISLIVGDPIGVIDQQLKPHSIHLLIILYIKTIFQPMPCLICHTSETRKLDSFLLFPVSLSVCLSICLSVCLYVCMYVCMSIRPSVCPSICLSVCLSICLSVCLSVSLSVCLSVYLSVCLSVCPSVYLSVHLSIYLSICLSICLSVCLSIC